MQHLLSKLNCSWLPLQRANHTKSREMKMALNEMEPNRILVKSITTTIIQDCSQTISNSLNCNISMFHVSYY